MTERVTDRRVMWPDGSTSLPPIDLASGDPLAPGTPSRATVVMDRYACPECGAGKGELCATSGGIVTRDPHMARWRVADRAQRVTGRTGAL